jgi:hypothetical protein
MASLASRTRACCYVTKQNEERDTIARRSPIGRGTFLESKGRGGAFETSEKDVTLSDWLQIRGQTGYVADAIVATDATPAARLIQLRKTLLPRSTRVYTRGSVNGGDTLTETGNIGRAFLI